MEIGHFNKVNASNLLTAGSQAVAKLSIPKSSRQINADSLKWLDRLGSSIGKHIRSSIESGKLFELASLGANIFGIPAFLERGETHHPVLNFEPGHDQGLNLSSVDMQSPTGELNQWASARNASATATPPAVPERGRSQNHEAPPPLPQRPHISSLTSMGLALGNIQQAKINNHLVGSSPLPARNPAGNQGLHQGSRATAMDHRQAWGSRLPATPPPTPPIRPQQPAAANISEAQDALGTPLDEIETFMLGPSFRPAMESTSAQQNTPRRASEPSILPSKPVAQVQLPANTPVRIDQPSIGEGLIGVPDTLRPGLGRRFQSNPVNGPNAASPPVSSEVPDSLRPGAVSRRASEPTNAIEARSRFAAATAWAPAGSSVAVQPSNTAPVQFTDLQPMLSVYKGEETGRVFGTQVKYLSDHERAAFKVTIRGGKVYDATGKLFDTRQATTAFALNKGRAIFVMDATGAMYVSNEQTRGKFHHSSFLRGGAVAAAGDVRIENGQITAISRKSGHYRPTEAQLSQAVNYLKSQGVSRVYIDEDLN